MIVRGVTHRIRFHIDPALSFVPDARAPTEGLLSDDGSGRFVVDVEVSRGVAEPVLRLLNRGAILGEHCAGQPVGRICVDEVERLAPARLVVEVRRHDRPEELLAQQPERRVARLEDGRLDEPAGGAVRASAGHDLVVSGGRASSIAARCVANEVSSITAPMKFEKSATSPTLIVAISSASRSRSAGQRLDGA